MMAGLLDLLFAAQPFAQAQVPLQGTPWQLPQGSDPVPTRPQGQAPTLGLLQQQAGGLPPLPAPIEIPGRKVAAVDPIIPGPESMPRSKPGTEPDQAMMPANARPAQGPLPGMLFGSAQPAQGFSPLQSITRDTPLAGVADWAAQNRSTLMALASGLMGAQNLGEGLSRGFRNATAGSQMDQQAAQGRQQQNATYRYLTNHGMAPDDAMAMLSNPEALNGYLKTMFTPRQPVAVGENSSLVDPVTGQVVYQGAGSAGTMAAQASQRAQLARQYGVDPNSPTGQAFILSGKFSEGANAPAGYRWSADRTGLEAIPGGPGEKIDAAEAARLGLTKSFLEQLPGIKKSVEGGEATGLIEGPLGAAGYGRSAEIRRQVQSGVDALLRNLTGAGMSQTEAESYARRYALGWGDSQDTVLSKLKQLDRELRSTADVLGRGRGGAGFINGIPSAFQASGQQGQRGQSAPTGGSLQPGAVVNGFVYRGGNPNDPNSWGRAQ
ncbi:hypothetical protein [Xanthobacter versatilis]|uniref:hypothetical protein n=1 Tax=Xanthobacter autotrophicus (strain ATCC BAA-1158 / Py2) TaxID=78245 RepID=UPI003727A3DD